MSANRVFKVTDVADYSEMRCTDELKRAYVSAVRDMSEALFLASVIRSLKVTDDASEGGR